MAIQSNGGSNNLHFTSGINSRWWQLFKFQEGAYVVNQKGKVMDVSGGLDNENQNIVVSNKNDKVSQRW